MSITEKARDQDEATNSSEHISSTTRVVPDGGLQAWLAVFGGWLVMFCTFGYANSFGVYQDYYVLAHASSSFDISWIGSLQIFFSFFVGLPAGLLLDLGYFRVTSVLGTLLFVFSMFMLSLVNPAKYYQIILSQGVGMGLGSGLLLVPAQSVQAHHWSKRRALAMGIMATGSGVGGIVYPIMLNQLIHGRVGFAWGVRATAFLTLGLLVIASCVITTRLPSIEERRSRPKPDIKAIVTDIPYVVLFTGIFLAIWGLYYPYFFLQLWVNLHGLSNTLAFYTLAILNAGSLPGRVVLNHLADRWGPFNILCPVVFVMGALVFAMFGATSTGSVIVFSILYGFFSGSFLSLVAPVLAALAKDVDEVGIRIGMAYCISSFAFLTGTPIAGALFDSDYRWYKPTIFGGVVLVAGSVFITISRFLYARRKGVIYSDAGEISFPERHIGQESAQ